MHKELLPDEIYDMFTRAYVDITEPLNITEAHFVQKKDGIEAKIDIVWSGWQLGATDSGNGRLDAVSNALKSATELDFSVNEYTEHALEVGSTSKAVSYVEIKSGKGESFWGTGIDTDIMKSSIRALVSAVNNMLKK